MQGHSRDVIFRFLERRVMCKMQDQSAMAKHVHMLAWKNKGKAAQWKAKTLCEQLPNM